MPEQPERPDLGLDLLRCKWRVDEATSPGTPAARLAGVRRENTEILAVIITAGRGWPGHRLVGERAAHAAALIAVETPDLAFQDRVLPLLNEAVRAGDADAKDLALLTDRNFVRHRRPQMFGTQYLPGQHGLTLYPCIAPGELDWRRQALGLEPHAEYDARIRGGHTLLAPPEPGLRTALEPGAL
ncbi:DUF6624 domain-containing protein [Streptomyces sp. MI02-7b]|uniref:DUF6624 domain-containing protein n=1 Tax=Streptomyces sp. MI02-7b TaxID=462941 RepID=UPI0029A0DE96|nr:DUF6624 domain-containing protein [Streptomyces sp. MI02-7b]MDX3075820.1 hypothetical protein [Streptomyces sp. MI02-7b]